MNIIRQHDPQHKLTHSWRNKVNAPVKATNVLAFAKALAEHMNGSWERKSSDSAAITFLYNTMQPVYELLFTCLVNSRTREFSVTVTLVRNSLPVRVSCASTTILLSRHFNRLNADVKYFMFRVNPLTRQFSVKQTTVFSKRQFDENIGNIPVGIQYVVTELNSAV